MVGYSDAPERTRAPTMTSTSHVAFPHGHGRADAAHALSDAKATLHITKSRMKDQYKHGKKTAHKFNVGNFVGLSSKDIKIHQQSPKLGPCQLSPFKVLERIRELDYKIELPP